VSEIRSVSVRLDADIAGYIAKMKLAGAATDSAFGRSTRGISSVNQKLGTTDSQLRKVSTSARRLGTDFDQTRLKVDTGARSIDRYSGRLGVLLDLVLGLGPGLIPIGAVAVPAVAALGTNLLGVVGALGVAKLAIVGVGDALKAVNKYALDPTQENLTAAHQALEQLPPSARRFTLELAAMRPELKNLQSIAANGLLPGVQQGLQSLVGDLPIVRQGIRGISTELGNLAADAGASLSSDRWQPFLKFVSREAPIGLGVMGHALGDVTHGVAELFMAFGSTTHDIDRGILRLADDFDRWASSVGRTKGFQDFLAYVDENGPRVLDLLGNTAMAFIDISRAAAPLGGPVLDTLNLFLRVVDAIAKSDLGTPIFTGIVALRLLTRATQLWQTTSTGAVGTFIAGQKAAVVAIRQSTAAQQQGVLSAKELAAVQARGAAGWMTLRGGALKAGAGLAGIGLIASGVTDKLHLTNTATLAMAGSMAGPWGAAIGAGVGLLLDFGHHQDTSAAATTDFTATLNQQTGAITENTTALAAQALQKDGAFEDAQKLGIGLDTITQAAVGNTEALSQVNAQLDYFLEKTKPGYVAGGAQPIPPEQIKAAGDLSKELGILGGTIDEDQKKTRELAEATAHNSSTADRSVAAHRRLAASIQGEKKAAADGVAQWKLFDDTLDKSSVSLNQWIRNMQKTANALANFGQNALRAARKGLDEGLIKSLNEAGPAGALRMRQLANASQKEIGRANAAWQSFQGATNDATQALFRATNHQWRVNIEDKQALAALQAISSQLNALHDKTIRVTTQHFTGGHSVAGDADGGTVPGPRYPYGDKVIRALAPGEEVITNRHGEADAFRRDRATGRIPAYGMADGGTVTHVTSSGPTLTAGDSGLGAEARKTTTALQRLRHSLADSTKELDAERQHRQDLAQQRASLVSSVRSNFQNTLFGTTDNGIWSGSSTTDPVAILKGDIRNARSYRRDIRRLRGRGLSAAVLAQITNLDDAEQALGLSPHELREISRLYRVRQRASQSAGATAGNIRFGDQLAESNRHLLGLQAEVKRLRGDVQHLEHAQAQHAKDTGKEVGNQINKSARDATRRAHR